MIHKPHPHTLAALRVSRVLFNRIHLSGASAEGRKQQKNGPKPRKKTVTVTIMTIIVTIMIVAVQRVASHRSSGAGNAALR